MGIDPLLKQILFAWYGKAWRRTSRTIPNSKSQTYGGRSKNTPNHHLPWNDFNPDSEILMIDVNMKIKYLNKSTQSGIDLVKRQIMQEAEYFLNHTNGQTVYLCFDLTPGLINKAREQGKREKSKKQKEMTIPVYTIQNNRRSMTITDSDKIENDETYFVDEEYKIIDNEKIPTRDEWQSFLKNKILYPELIHYITSFIINPASTGLTNVESYKSVQVPKDKRLFLWGGSLIPPKPRAVRMGMPIMNVKLETFESSVFYVGNYYNDEQGKYVRSSGRCCPSTFNLPTLQNLKEAEHAVMYFTTVVSDRNITVLSGDGDLIFLLLLQSKDRIDENGNWRNRIYLRLVKKKNAKMLFDDNEPSVEEIDINCLYELIMNDSRLNLTKGIADPVIYLSAISILLKNDYSEKFGPGLGTINVDHKGMRKEVTTTLFNEKEVYSESYPEITKIPTILYTFLVNPTRYKNLFEVMVCDKDRNYHFGIVPIRVNEEEFINFTRECYYHRYLEEASKKLNRLPSKITVADVRTYLEKHRGIKSNKDQQTENSIRNRMMVQRVIRVYARQLLWTLNYWQNTYRAYGEYPLPPTLRYKHASFYGWVQDGSACKTSAFVSPWVPLDLEFIKKNSINSGTSLSSDQNEKKRM